METSSGISSIRVFRWQDQFTNPMIEMVDKSQVPYYLQRWLQLVLYLMVAALAIIVITLAIKLRKSTDPGSLGLSLNNVLSFNEILTLLLQYWTQLEVSLGAISRTIKFSNQTPSEPNPATLTSLSDTWPEHGNIEINKLSARYTPSSLALNNITLSIRPGKKIGLCGRSGSGKSSLLSAILRLLKPSSGSIVIGGIDLASIDHKTIREWLLTIPQDAFLLQHTTRFNLDPLAHHTDVQIIGALSKVGLWGILEERGGLNAIMTTNFLSQGQKKLVSLARVILTKNNRGVTGGVLLLDEATSNIDRDTDGVIQRVIREEFKGYTVLVVAHRLDTIMDSERIAVLEAERIVEFDSPQRSLERDSAFSALYNARGSEGKSSL